MKSVYSYVIAFAALVVFASLVSVGSAQTWDRQINNPNRFKVLGEFNDEAVLDRETELVWERSPSTIQPTFWAEALSRCYAKNLGGRLGWRPPTVEELTSLIDRTQSNPTLPSGHPFLNVQLSSPYWSATTSANFTSGAWVVNFGTGVPDSGFDKAGGNGFLLIWCVRGGQGYDGR